jgi:sugar O-acyltransferase (sialic acid O-acetyltransferase NeuD family)
MKAIKKSIIIVGAQISGYAGEVFELLEELDSYEVVGFIDNAPEFQNKTIQGIPVLGPTDNLELLDLPTNNFHIAIGDNVTRGNIFKKLKELGKNVITIVHPQAIVSKTAAISEGCYIGPEAIINRNVQVGEVSIIDSGSIIQQNTRIGFAVSLSSGVKVANGVQIDDYSFVGMGSSILSDIHVGSGVMIDIGSIVKSNVPSGRTMIEYAAKEYPKNIYRDFEPDISPMQKVYVAQPTLPEYPLLDEKFRDIAKSLILSNFAKYSNELEKSVQDMLSVKKALTFPNATSALMLAIKAMDITGEVILPSFTFSATGHAVVWNGLTPVFADIDSLTFNIDPDDVERKITNKTSAILAVHVFGNPADIERLEQIAKEHDLKLLFDSAHALGSTYNDKPIGGFGDAECFSLSGTKVITSAEGGLVTSNNEEYMQKMHLGRNYGAGSDYDCQYIGLNGKMSEFHAAIALESLSLLTKFVYTRNKLANLYKKRLRDIPGIQFQHIPEGCISTFKDFSIIVDPDVFGMNRDELIKRLNEEEIFPKKYFYPPLHCMNAYKNIEHRAESLVNTELIANNIVCLPIYSHMEVDTLEKICYAVYRIWNSKNKR